MKRYDMDPNTVTIGSALVIFAGLFGFWWKLDAKIDNVESKLSDEIKGLDSKIDRVDSKLSGEIRGVDSKLSGEIKEVRLASETAHKQILNRLGEIEKVQATHTERFNTVNARINCIEDKIDALASPD